MKNKSNINVILLFKSYQKISNKLEQIEPPINVVNENLTKQECKALKELQKDQNLVIRKAGKGNILVITEKHYYWNALKHHLSTSTHQKVNTNSVKYVFGNLKSLIKKNKT